MCCQNKPCNYGNTKEMAAVMSPMKTKLVMYRDILSALKSILNIVIKEKFSTTLHSLNIIISTSLIIIEK